MPTISINATALSTFGATWTSLGERLSRTPPNSSAQLGNLFDAALGNSLSKLLGGIPLVQQTTDSLMPPKPDCVEFGSPRIVGGIRPQNFDVCYRPDGVRFAHDTKTLNDSKSVKKNWQNMINDIATEATTVHSRFPHAVVTFIVAVPEPAIGKTQRAAITETLERLARRVEVNDPSYLAEAIALVLWDPKTGQLDPNIPAPTSHIRIEAMAAAIERVYVTRYKGLPPHAA